MSSYALGRSSGINAFFLGTFGATAEADAVSSELERIRQQSRTRASNWLPAIDAALTEIQEECSQADWDGYGASPIKPEALLRARVAADTLQRLVPSAIPSPDVVPEVDGDISLSWTKGRNYGLSISFSDHDMISFAGTFGSGNVRHGSETIDASDTRTFEDVARLLVRLYTRK